MKVVKRTDAYTIYQRGDDRYAVQDAEKKPVNGEDKVRILVEEGLLTVAAPAAPEPEETPADDAAGDDGAEGAEGAEGADSTEESAEDDDAS